MLLWTLVWLSRLQSSMSGKYFRVIKNKEYENKGQWWLTGFFFVFVK